MKRIVALAVIAILTVTQFATQDAPVNAEPPDKGVTAKEFRLDEQTLKALKEAPLDLWPDGVSMDSLMTKQELESTGVSRLSPAEKAVLGRWYGKLVFIVYSSARTGMSDPPINIYHFHLDKAPPLLTEDLAIEKARIAFVKEGYDPAKWQLTRADNPPSEAPDGTPDKHFVRYSNSRGGFANQGRFHFTDGKHSCMVQVSLETNWVVCQMVFGP